MYPKDFIGVRGDTSLSLSLSVLINTIFVYHFVEKISENKEVTENGSIDFQIGDLSPSTHFL